MTFDTSEDANSVLRGFTITGGDSTFSGGVFCDGSSPTIRNCVIRGNSAQYGGGMENEDSSCPTVTNCVFVDNTADWYGGAIENYGGSSPTITNCLFYGNSATDLGYGGAIDNDGSSPTITNCTFNGNSTDYYGGGICNYGSTSKPILTNCIVWGNSADDGGDEVYNYSSADPNFTYCDVNGCGGSSSWDANFGTDGGGNIDADPNFVDPTDPNGADDEWGTPDDGLRFVDTGFVVSSPCVDAGNGSDAPSTDISAFPRVDIQGVNNTGGGSPSYADMGAYENQWGLFPNYDSMEVNSVSADPNDPNCITIVTTGAKYVLTPADMNMFCRIDVNTNTTFADVNVLLVGRLEFDTNMTSLTPGPNDANRAVVESTQATFEFLSDSLVLITAKSSFTYDHNSLIDAEWNAPLEAGERDANRMWADPNGGSLHAQVSGDPNCTDPSTDFTTISMSSGDKMAHMVFPPKLFDFEGLYDANARPHVCFVLLKSEADELLEPNGMDQYVQDGFGAFIVWTWPYTGGWQPVELDSGVWGYEIDPADANDFNDFIVAAHDSNFKVISYTRRLSHDCWHGQDVQVTLDWMRSLQEDNNLDGWYMDNGDAGGFLDDYDFMRQVRTDVGDDGIIYHHDSGDVWDERWKDGSSDYSGLRAVMVDAYASYTKTGEAGNIATVHHLNDPYFRYYTGGYGLSQAYAAHKLRGNGTATITEREKCRLIGENLNGTQTLGPHEKPYWSDYFKPAFQSRKDDYNDLNTFTADVDWPLDPCTGWFRAASINDININDTTVTVTWNTGENSDSNVVLTNNQRWYNAQSFSEDGYDAYAYSAIPTTDHNLAIARTDLVPGDSYEYRIRSETDASVPGKIVYHYLSNHDYPNDPNIDDPDIVGHWKFEEASGNTVYDSAGDNDGNISGGSSAIRSNTGIVGTGISVSKALNFDGTDDYVQIPDDDSIRLGDHDYTITAWIRPDSVSGMQGIVTKIKDANDKEYAFSLDGNELRLDVEKDGNDQYGRTTTGPA
ncbi:MAG: LamG-like jellyroll fold domain-containing protein, partial [Planctomycetota bacterium]